MYSINVNLGPDQVLGRIGTLYPIIVNGYNSNGESVTPVSELTDRVSSDDSSCSCKLDIRCDMDGIVLTTDENNSHSFRTTSNFTQAALYFEIVVRHRFLIFKIYFGSLV